MELGNIRIKPNAINLTIYAHQGDIGSVIALHKLTEVRNLISFANIAIDRAIGEKDNIVKYCLFRSAILDYNACYDYILQIIYFGFDFCSRVDSHESYISQMKNDCRRTIEQNENGKRVLIDSPFKQKIDELKIVNDRAKDFFSAYDRFRRSSYKPDVAILEWANNIKHQGGFIVEELLDRKSIARVKTSNKEGELFDSSYMFSPITFSDIENRLCKQNELIVKFLMYLQDAIFGDTTNIDIGVSQKHFTANGYNKADLVGNAYLTSFEIDEI